MVFEKNSCDINVTHLDRETTDLQTIDLPITGLLKNMSVRRLVILTTGLKTNRPKLDMKQLVFLTAGIETSFTS